MTNHSLLSPSNAHRWLNCSASLAMEYVLCKQNIIPSDTSTPEAREGTAAHWLAERYRAQDTQLNEYLGQSTVVDYVDENGNNQKDVIKFGQEMIDAVETYWNYIDSIPHDKEWIEKRVSYDHIAKNQSGIADCFFETVEKIDNKPVPSLYVLDFKYGKGIKVYAHENPQGMLYASGVLKEYKNYFKRKIKRVVIVIIQPRLDWISEYSISVEDLEKWGKEKVKPKAELAIGLYNFAKDEKPNPDKNGKYDLIIKSDMFNPSKKTCQWCKAKGLCKAQAKKVFEKAIEGFEDISNSAINEKDGISKAINTCLSFKGNDSKKWMIDAFSLSNEDLSTTWQMFPYINKFIETIEEIILKKLLAGASIPKLKPIQPDGNRKWKNDKIDVEYEFSNYGLDSDEYMTEPSFKTPNQILELIKKKCKNWKPIWKKLEEKIIERPKGKIRIAYENDKNPSIAPIKNDLDFLDTSSDTNDLDFLDTSSDTNDLDFLDTSSESLDIDELDFLK